MTGPDSNLEAQSVWVGMKSIAAQQGNEPNNEGYLEVCVSLGGGWAKLFHREPGWNVFHLPEAPLAIKQLGLNVYQDHIWMV